MTYLILASYFSWSPDLIDFMWKNWFLFFLIFEILCYFIFFNFIFLKFGILIYFKKENIVNWLFRQMSYYGNPKYCQSIFQPEPI